MYKVQLYFWNTNNSSAEHTTGREFVFSAIKEREQENNGELQQAVLCEKCFRLGYFNAVQFLQM